MKNEDCYNSFTKETAVAALKSINMLDKFSNIEFRNVSLTLWYKEAGTRTFRLIRRKGMWVVRHDGWVFYEPEFPGQNAGLTHVYCYFHSLERAIKRLISERREL